MICGTSRERRRRNGGIDPKAVNGVRAPQPPGVGQDSVLSGVLHTVTLYILRFIPEIFQSSALRLPGRLPPLHLPHAAGFGLPGADTKLFHEERESAFIIIVFTSVVFLFLSGLTWPRCMQ